MSYLYRMRAEELHSDRYHINTSPRYRYLPPYALRGVTVHIFLPIQSGFLQMTHTPLHLFGSGNFGKDSYAKPLSPPTESQPPVQSVNHSAPAEPIYYSLHVKNRTSRTKEVRRARGGQPRLAPNKVYRRHDYLCDDLILKPREALRPRPFSNLRPFEAM